MVTPSWFQLPVITTAHVTAASAGSKAGTIFDLCQVGPEEWETATARLEFGPGISWGQVGGPDVFVEKLFCNQFMVMICYDFLCSLMTPRSETDNYQRYTILIDSTH